MSKTICCFDHVPLGASDLAEIRGWIRMLHRQIPELPIYLMEGEVEGAGQKAVIDKELERRLAAEGVCGVIRGGQKAGWCSRTDTQNSESHIYAENGQAAEGTG